jgi:hypothetical protein
MVVGEGAKDVLERGVTRGSEFRGPLRVSTKNPRYFTDDSGRAIFLGGSHTWANLIEHKVSADEADFDYGAYLDFMAAHNHNFMRLWGWEHARWATWDGTGRFFAYPLPYARTGPGSALDGLPKFDLHQFEPAYFERLRSRATAAGRRGIYVGVKLFDGFSVGFKGSGPTPAHTPDRNPYRGHPFNAANNVNGINGDPDGTGQGKAVQTLRIPEITKLHEAYIRKVVDTVDDLDNVLYEICNESDGDQECVEWQYHMIRFLKQYESTKPKQHLVGMTVPYPGGQNHTLFDSPADWVSPNHTAAEPYKDDPPAADGKKVVLSDTDHLWGLGGIQPWVWKSFTRGMNTLLMDPWEPLKGADLYGNNYRDHPTWEPIRRSIGHARAYANRMDLVAMVPRGDLSSTAYCLACPGREYLVYQPEVARFQVNLKDGSGPFSVEWFGPSTGSRKEAQPVQGGDVRSFTPPFASDAVLYLRAQ